MIGETNVSCKFCQSTDVVKYGSRHGIQRWWCKACRRKFADNRALAGMRVPLEIVAAALKMFYEGMSLNGIRRELKQGYQICPSDSTVHKWITVFTGEALAVSAGRKPTIGDVWLVMSKRLRVRGADTQLWDVIDIGSAFLLASHQESPPDVKGLVRVLDDAVQRAGRWPKVIVADKVADFQSASELMDKARVIGTPEFLRTEFQARIIAGFRSVSITRDKILQTVKKRDTAELFAQGWLIHYNFFIRNQTLGDKSPAQKARMRQPPDNWEDLLKRGNSRCR